MTPAAIIVASLLGLALVASSVWDRRRLDAARKQADQAATSARIEHDGRLTAEQQLAAERARTTELQGALAGARAETATVERELAQAQLRLQRRESPADRSDEMGRPS